MKIALISSAIHQCPPSGYGSEATTFYLATELAKRKHEVLLFAPKGSGTPPGGRLIEIPLAPPNSGEEIMASEASPVTKHSKELRSCDIVHDCSLSAGTAELTCKSFLDRVPHLATLNGIYFARPLAPANHDVVVVSNAAKYHAENGIGAFENTPFRSKFHCDPGVLKNPYVVRYGTDVEFYAPRPRPRPEDGVYHVAGIAVRLRPLDLLYVGRPHPAKGFDILLGLAERMPDNIITCAWRAWLPDHVHYDKMYRAEVKQRGIKNIEFVELPDGPEHHVVKRDLQASAAVALHPATYVDACPSTLMEALACGTPVVTTKHGGNPELVLDGQDGVCLPIPLRYWEEPQWSTWLDEWVAAIRKAASLDRRDIRARAVERHSAARMADDYLKVYDTIINGSPK